MLGSSFKVNPESVNSKILNSWLGPNSKLRNSAGCGIGTKGLNASLFTTDVEGAKEILLLDSEGLFSAERSDPKFDRRLAAFCVANSNFLMINIKNELTTDIQNVLESVVFMLGKVPTLNTLNKKPRFHFILHDQDDDVSNNIKHSFDGLRAKLESSARAAGCRGGLDDLINLPREADDAIDIFSSAIEPQSINYNPNYKPL